MSLIAVSRKISKVGIKRETAHGTIAAGPFRGLLVTDFSSSRVSDASTYQLLSGSKGQHAQNLSGSHQEVSFTLVAGSSDASMGSLTDIMHMIFDADVVTGVNPYTHTFALSTVTQTKKSWTLFHDDGRSNYRVFRGFVVDTVSITIDKESGNIPIEVSGFAWEEVDHTIQTVDFTSGVGIYNPRQCEVFIAASILENFKTATIEFATAAAIHNTINSTAFPSQIDGQNMVCTVALEGVWNEGVSQQSDNLRTAFMNNTVVSNLFLRMGPSQVNDGFRLTIPKWVITEHSAKDLSDETLPQSFTAEAIHEGDAATNGFKVDIFNTIATDWDAI
jgi:hypothetical protein